MKFKGKKIIMAAALSAIVAAGSFGTAITASATDTYSISIVKGYNIGAYGNITVSKTLDISAGESITVTVTPDDGSYIHYFVISNDPFYETVMYELSNYSDTAVSYTFTMPANRVYVYAGFHALPMPTPEPTPTPSPTPTWKKGDVNLDGYVNAEDATLVLKHTVELIKLTGQGYINADVNGDGYINAKDATKILRIAVGFE